MTEIYYVEDDGSIAADVKEYFERQGYRVSVFVTIAEAKRAFQSNCPALVLVDWNMPDGSGNSLCQWIRWNRKEVPVILLTVRGDARDIVSGFRNGADDYVVKPFALDVLLSHVRAVLRRTGDISGKYLSCGAISIDQERMLVCCDSKEISLARSEYQLLLYLMQNKGKIVTREKLLEKIWDCNGNYVNDNTLTVTIKRLREKLHQPSCLKTVRSIGYCMEENG